MTEQQKHSCCSKNSDQDKAQFEQTIELIDIDPVCGMEVDEDSPHFIFSNDKKYLFCSHICKEKFELRPSNYINEIDYKKVSINFFEHNTPSEHNHHFVQSDAAQKNQSCCSSLKKNEQFLKLNSSQV